MRKKRVDLDWDNPKVLGKFIETLHRTHNISEIAAEMGVCYMTIQRQLPKFIKKMEALREEIDSLRAKRAVKRNVG